MFGTSMERPGTWAIIAIAALVLFGYKRLPEVTRSVGKSLRIFKTEMKGLSSDDEAREAAEAAKTPPPTASDAKAAAVEPPTVSAQPTTPAVEATPASTPEQTPPQPSS